MERVSGTTSTIKDKPMDPDDLFTTETTGLSEAARPELVRLRNGDRLHLRIEPVRTRLENAELRMLRSQGRLCMSIRDRRSPCR